MNVSHKNGVTLLYQDISDSTSQNLFFCLNFTKLKLTEVYKQYFTMCSSVYIDHFIFHSFHEDNYSNRRPESFINNHQQEMHGGQAPDFKCSVLKTFKDPLSRQVCEGVQIRRLPGGVLNSKLEYYQQGTYTMDRQVNHG